MAKTFLEDKNKQRNMIFAATIAVGLLFGFFIGRMWSGKNAGEIADLDEKNATSTLGTTLGDTSAKDSIALSEQGAGNVVFVNKAVFTKDSWIVVHEDRDGEFGNILGAGWFPKGTNENVTVELLRGTEADKKYYAVVYNDDGDKKFDAKIDAPITENGKAIQQAFTVK